METNLKCSIRCWKKFFRYNYLAILTVIGVVCGIGLGFGLRQREEPWSDREVMYVGFIGKIFLSMLKVTILPLIVPSLIASIGSLDLRLSGKVGGRAMAYYITTTILAVILGISLVVAIQPGSGVSAKALEGGEHKMLTVDTLLDLVRNCFPPNIVQACIEQRSTKLVEPELKNGSNESLPPMEEWEIDQTWKRNTNILGLIVFSIVLAIAIIVADQDGQPLLNFFSSTASVMMLMTNWIVHLAPVGVVFLIAKEIIDMENMAEEFTSLAFYFLTVLLGLTIHGFITLPLLFYLCTCKCPCKYIWNLTPALLTAFGTSSSAASLPVTIKCIEEKNGVDPRIARFVLPIGATINMDGTALYEAVACLYISQVRNMNLSFGDILAVSITATAASIGAAGIPSAGLVTLVMVLDSVGLNSEDVSMILAVDWLLDRCRTTVNVLGDALGAGIVNHMSKRDLQRLDEDSIETRSSTVSKDRPKTANDVAVQVNSSKVDIVEVKGKESDPDLEIKPRSPKSFWFVRTARTLNSKRKKKKKKKLEDKYNSTSKEVKHIDYVKHEKLDLYPNHSHSKNGHKEREVFRIQSEHDIHYPHNRAKMFRYKVRNTEQQREPVLLPHEQYPPPRPPAPPPPAPPSYDGQEEKLHPADKHDPQ